MISWHEKSCLRPDVSLVDASPFCMSCGSLASLDDLDWGQAPRPPPIPTQRRADLALSWPSSVRYSPRCVGSDGRDLGSQLVEVVSGTCSQGYDMDLDDDISSETDGTLSGDEGPDEHLGPAPSVFAKQDNEQVDELAGTDTIRILRLSKGKGSEPLHGELQVRQLKYFPEYEALSYTWANANGYAGRTKKLYIGNGWDILPITANCEAALRTLRLPNKERHVWVDALCINHTRVRERSSQVQLMPVIYATAQRVLVYLGDDRPTIDIKASRLKAGRNGWDERWDEMDENLKRPYFFRSWIIQEIAMAKTALVTDGNTWRVWPIHCNLAQTKTFLPWIRHFDKRKYKTPNDLVQLVIDSWSSQASDPRDKVFALLGVISGGAADGLTADYSLSVEHVYTGFASFALQKVGATSLLKYAGGYEKSPGLPSWVPDWRQLSQDWAIMARIELFHSQERLDDLVKGFRISLERTELLTRPWPVSGRSTPSSDISIHHQTGALCLSGIMITELPLPRGAEPFKDTFRVYQLEGFFIAAPITARQGDLVYFLQGFNTPVILRRQNSTVNDVFSFVGMCYARIQTGIVLQRHTNQINNFTWLQGITTGSLLAIQMPDSWNQRWPPDVDEPNEVQEALRELFGVELAAYSPEQYSLLQELGQEVERRWTNILRQNLPMVLMMPDLSCSDIMAPVPVVLEELKQAMGELSSMWTEAITHLEACKQYGQLPSDRRGQILAWCTQLERRNENILAHDLEANWARMSIVDEEVQDELKVWYSTRWTDPVPSSSDPLIENERDPDAYCPRWYRYHADGKHWWYAMVRKQAIMAAEHLRVAVPEMELGAQAGSTFVSPRITLEGSMREARGWQRMFEMAIEEIGLVKRAVEILLQQRRRYRALTSGGWRRIAIV